MKEHFERKKIRRPTYTLTEKKTSSEALTTTNFIITIYHELSLEMTTESVEVTTFAFALDTKHTSYFSKTSDH